MWGRVTTDRGGLHLLGTFFGVAGINDEFEGLSDDTPETSNGLRSF